MLSLFSSKKSSSIAPKPPPKETQSFDFDSFIHQANSSSKNDQSNQSQKDIEKLLDVTTESRKPKPAVSKATQKMLQKVNDKHERIPKEIEKASKRISNSLKQFVSGLENNKPKPTSRNSIKKDISDNHKSSFKPRPDSERLRYPSSPYEDQGTRFLQSPNMKGEGPYRKGSLNSSPNATSHRRMPPKDVNERPRFLSKDRIHEKKSDEDLNYNPLESSPFSLREDPEWKVNVSDSYEQYDPLDVSLKKKPAEPVRSLNKEPSGLIGLTDLTSLTNKRMMLGDNGNSRYEHELIKKVKMDDYARRDAGRGLYNNARKVAPISQHQGRNVNKGYVDDEDDYEEDGSEVEEIDGDDEAMREYNMMMASYRNKVNRRAQEYDSSDMEAGFDDIEAEERISRRIGEMEDREELKLIQQEEMRERRGKIN